jgi:hypothetical protein
LVSAKGPSDDHAGALAAQGHRATGRTEPCGRAQAFLADQPIADLKQLSHQRRILLLAPGLDHALRVIRQDGVKHEFASI